ncbi:hypothetical protein QFZ64_005860 [Streptomyces sp. B3I8]|nr:hypothetical protein [Streptomyces sp. B3I8]
MPIVSPVNSSTTGPPLNPVVRSLAFVNWSSRPAAPPPGSRPPASPYPKRPPGGAWEGNPYEKTRCP